MTYIIDEFFNLVDYEEVQKELHRRENRLNTDASIKSNQFSIGKRLSKRPKKAIIKKPVDNPEKIEIEKITYVKKAINLVICPICNAKISRRRFESHLLRVHNRKEPSLNNDQIMIKNNFSSAEASGLVIGESENRVTSTNKKKNWFWNKCPFCLKQLKEKQFEYHFAKIHHAKLTPGNDLFTCLICQDNIKISEYNVHYHNPGQVILPSNKKKY